MRKLLMAVAVVMLAIAVTVPAMALDFKFSSANRFRLYSTDGVGPETASIATSPFNETRTNQNDQADLRFRPWFRVSDDNGNVQSEVRLEIGDVTFGDGAGNVGRSSGGGVGADGVNIETKWAYIDVAMPFGIPARLRGGLQPYFLPKGAIIDNDGAGLRLYGTVKPFSYDFWWLAVSETQNVGQAASPTTGVLQGPANDDVDAYAAKFDLALMPAFNPYVYGVYRRGTVTSAGVGSESTQDYWIGAGTVGKFGIVKYDFDFVYGDSDGNLAQEQKGWFADFGIEVPVGPLAVGFRAMYATGNDGEDGDNKNEDFPTLSPSYVMNGMSQIFWDRGGATHFGGGGVAGSYQAGPWNTWALGGYVQYVPVKPLTLKATYIYLAAVDRDTNFYTGKATIGHELEFLASYQLWTGTKANLFAGVIIPPGDLRDPITGTETESKMAQVYAFTVTHDF